MHNLKGLYTSKSVTVSNFSALRWIYFGDFTIFAEDKVYFICIGERIYYPQSCSCDQ